MIRYFDMFAGIGGFRSGLTLADGFECVGHCEIDKYADASYRAIHNIQESEVFYPDARKIEPRDMPDFDLLCGGFPCQSFSLAGRRKGFEDVRGTLFFELARIAAAKRPRYLLFENVPGLLSHAQGRTYATILNTLCELGYGVEWAVCNSKDHGVPQARRRVFIVGYLDGRCAGKVLPVGDTNTKALVRLAGEKQGYTVYDSNGLACTQTANTGGLGGKTGLYFIDMCKGKPKITENARCIKARQDSGITNHEGESSGVLTIDGMPHENEKCFVDLCYGKPQLTQMARCITAGYDKSRMSHRSELSGVLAIDDGQSAMDNSTAACAVINPTKEKVRQNGRRIKEPGEPMFTITVQDRHGVLLIKEATKRGYKEAHEGDTIDLGYAGSNTRRGRVGKDIAHTLDTGSTQGIVKHGRIRRLMPRECLRLQGFTDEQIDKILAFTSDAQAYKQAGNSVTVGVIYAIALRIKAVDEAIKAGELS